MRELKEQEIKIVSGGDGAVYFYLPLYEDNRWGATEIYSHTKDLTVVILNESPMACSCEVNCEIQYTVEPNRAITCIQPNKTLIKPSKYCTLGSFCSGLASWC